MNNGKLKRALSVFLTSAMLLSAAPVFAASGYLTDIGFDDAATNDQSEFVTVEGSSSGRVVEDGAMNKSYMVECGNVDNIVQVFLPELETDDKYIVQFDMRIEGASAEGKITLSNPQGTAFEVFTMDDGGKLRTSDNRSLGSINSSRMRTVSIALDNNSLTQSAGLDGNLDYYRQNMDVALPNVSTIEIATYATLGETKLYLDNIRVYSGESYRNEPSRTPYNSEALEYIETDESGLANKVYYRNALDSSSSMTMTKLAKRNTIEWLEEGDGGFVRMTKSTSDDAMIDMTISASSKRVIAECDVRFSKNAPETLFYFRDNSGATQINFAPVTISGDTITAQGSSMQLRKNVWYTISVALDVAKHTFAVYVDGELLAKDKTFNEDFANVSVWRMYVGGTALGAIDVDNLAFYGGTEPRDIENDEFTAVSRFSDTAALNFLRGKRAVQLYGSTAFFGSEKTELEHETVERNDERLLDVSTFETFFDTSVSVIDRTPPTIRLANSAVNVKAGTGEAEAERIILADITAADTQSGANAPMGDRFGEVTDGVHVSIDMSGVDLNRIGAYNAKVTASDRLGNTAEKDVKVLVVRDVYLFNINGVSVYANDVFTASKGRITIRGANADAKYYYSRGYKTAAQMKYAESFEPAQGFDASQSGYYTILAQESGRGMHLLYVYVN